MKDGTVIQNVVHLKIFLLRSQVNNYSDRYYIVPTFTLTCMTAFEVLFPYKSNMTQ